MIKVFCDRCGADITNAQQFGEVTGKLYTTPRFDVDTPVEWAFGLDDNRCYCKECMNEIRDFIRCCPEKVTVQKWWANAEPMPCTAKLEAEERNPGGRTTNETD